MTAANHDTLEAGFLIHCGLLPPAEIAELRLACDAVAAEAGSACVRQLLAKSARLREFANSPKLRALLPSGFRLVRSILFDKTPDENWPVAWHQDLTIAVTSKSDLPGYGPWSVKDGVTHVQPPIDVLERMRTLRIHLDDTPANNGALRVIPNSHRQGRVTRDVFSKAEEICECAPGDVLAMSPLILHASSRSAKPSRRRIIHLEFAAEGILHPSIDWSAAEY